MIWLLKKIINFTVFKLSYMFPVFGTAETKFWLTPSRAYSTSKLAKDYLAEEILAKL